MQADFWKERWRRGQIGFHQSEVDRHLRAHWEGLGLTHASRVFVPLCGKTIDVLWLQERGHCVSGVELSAVALEAFCLEHGVPARRHGSGAFDIYAAERLTLYCGDFFDLTPGLLGPVDAIFDRAALIAWQPERRRAYVDHLTRLTRDGCKMLLVTVEYPQSQMEGPPFAVAADEVHALFGADFSIRRLARENTLAREHRFRARGLTEFHEVCYALTRMSAPPS